MATIPNHRQIHAQLLIGRTDGHTWVDVSDYLKSVTVECGSIEDLGTGTGTDIGVRTLDFTLQNDGQNTQVWYSDDVLGDSADLWGDTTDIIGDTKDDLLPFLISILGAPDWLRESFAPKDKNSDWNNFDGKWNPLLWPYRGVALRVAITPPGDTPKDTDWIILFEGYMGDSIKTDHHSVSVMCRDKSKRLSDCHIDVAKTYKGPIAAEDLAQAIINDFCRMEITKTFEVNLYGGSTKTLVFDHSVINDFTGRLITPFNDLRDLTPGEISVDGNTATITINPMDINHYTELTVSYTTPYATIKCPVPSGITFDEYTVEYISVWNAIQNIATQMGWFLGYRWDGEEYALMFFEPPREKTTADFLLDWEDSIYKEGLTISDADIRNAVTITYRDKQKGKRATLRYTDHPELRNDASKDEYGGQYKVMQIEEKDTSLIDTEAEALAFGAKCLWDLSELSATDKLEIPLLPELDLFSTLEVYNPLISSTPDFYAVQSLRHSLDFAGGSFRTEIVAAGRVVGARTKWLNMETRPGKYVPVQGGDIINPGITEILVASVDAPLQVRTAATYQCDGINDHEQIQAAINDVATLGGGIVALSQGVFNILPQQIELKSNVILQGAGASTTLKCLGSEDIEYNNVIFAKTVNDVVVRNFAIEVVSQFIEEFEGDVFLPEHAPVLEYVSIEKWENDDWVMAGAYVQEQDETGLWMIVPGKYRITYEMIQNTNGIRFGIEQEHDLDFVQNATIENVKITNHGNRAIAILSASNPSKNCKVKGVIIENPRDIVYQQSGYTDGIVLIGIDGVQCLENTISRGDNGILISDCIDALVLNNSIVDPATSGIVMYTFSYGRSYTVSNNRITNAAGAIEIRGGKGTLITNNYIFGGSSVGIQVSGQAHMIQSNKIDGNGTLLVGIHILPDANETYLTNNDLAEAGAEKIKNEGANTYLGAGNKTV